MNQGTTNHYRRGQQRNYNFNATFSPQKLMRRRVAIGRAEF